MIHICLGCEASQSNRPGGCQGACACTAHPELLDIKVCVARRDCRLGKFGDGANATAAAADATAAKLPPPCTSCGRKIIDGAVGLAKVAAQAVGIPIDQTTRKVEAARLRICTGCDQNEDGKCRPCGCFVKLKVKIASEKCPMEKW